jgi:hypothetical protein
MPVRRKFKYLHRAIYDRDASRGDTVSEYSDCGGGCSRVRVRSILEMFRDIHGAFVAGICVGIGDVSERRRGCGFVVRRRAGG